MSDADDLDLDTLELEPFVRLGCIEILNRNNADRIDDIYAPDLTYYNTSGQVGTREDLKEDAYTFHRAFPDIEADIFEVVADDEDGRVAFEYEMRGTHEGEFHGYEPTGKRTSARGIGYAYLDGRTITEYHLTLDFRELLSKLGLVVI